MAVGRGDGLPSILCVQVAAFGSLYHRGCSPLMAPLEQLVMKDSHCLDY